MNPLGIVYLKAHAAGGDAVADPPVENPERADVVDDGVEEVIFIELGVVVAGVVASVEGIPPDANREVAYDRGGAGRTGGAPHATIGPPVALRPTEHTNPMVSRVNEHEGVSGACIALGTGDHRIMYRQSAVVIGMVGYPINVKIGISQHVTRVRATKVATSRDLKVADPYERAKIPVLGPVALELPIRERPRSRNDPAGAPVVDEPAIVVREVGPATTRVGGTIPED